MFLKHHDQSVSIDLSHELRDPQDWKVGILRSFEYPLNITTLAIEPVSGLLAFGTASGVIYIIGGPGVDCKLTLPEPFGVRFLQFSISTFKLVCLDENNLLHIWDLSTYGRPKLLISTRFDQTNCLTLSPSHTHAFLALQSGEVKTYDLTSLRKSPYTIPNLWILYADKMAASGMPEVSSPALRAPVETVIHPRDLNLLFVAYAGGVILSDLTQRNTLRTYEFVLPPGAPGGGGYESSNILTHRRPAVTSLAIHPSGHFFAVGYGDGSIAFWAVEDEDQPILVRTVEEMDVNVVDGHKLEKHLSQHKGAVEDGTPPPNREPIFKLSWSAFPNSSDPRGGETALTILGGLTMGEAAGLSVHWLPAFNPPEPPATNTTGTRKGLHLFIRNAMRESLTPSNTYFYCTSGIAQDYLLIPRGNPHFSGAFDPISILILSEAEGDSRVVEAYQFPPPTFLATAEEADPASKTETRDAADSSECLVDTLASTLKSLEMNGEPQRLRLPTSLLNGSSGLLNGQLLKLERDVYQILIGENVADSPKISLKGGFAWADDAKANELKLSKYQPHRILITYHRDLSVQFQDVSAQLLISLRPSPIENNFPKPMPHLTIDLNPLMRDTSVTRRMSPTFVDAHIDAIHLAPESLECVVVFHSGELVVYRLRSGPHDTVLYRDASDKEIIILEHISPQSASKFSPYFMLIPGKGLVTVCAISDIGFLASAYADGSLLVVDMRGPRIILRRNQDGDQKHRHSMGLRLHRHSGALDPIASLTWTVSTLGSDPELRIRLIAVHISGLLQIFTLSRHPGSTSWIFDEDPVTTETVANPLPHGIFILDSKSGAQWKADRGRLCASLHPTAVGNTHGICVTTGAKGARSVVDITGERIGKADWGSKGSIVQNVQIVEKNNSHVLVALTDRHEALVYSLPNLELLHTLLLQPVSSLPLSVDESGDFVVWTQHPKSGTITQATYATLFDIRRAYTLPDIDFASTEPIVSPQPQPVSVGPASLLSSWFSFGQSLTGEQLDALLGGPDRPIPQPKPRAARGAMIDNAATGTSALAGAAAGVQSNLYDRLTSAVNERGQMLGDLEERFNSLEEGSRNMVSQAKRLATEQTTKRWFGL